jgi:hypothetical protein
MHAGQGQSFGGSRLKAIFSGLVPRLFAVAFPVTQFTPWMCGWDCDLFLAMNNSLSALPELCREGSNIISR